MHRYKEFDSTGGDYSAQLSNLSFSPFLISTDSESGSTNAWYLPMTCQSSLDSPSSGRLHRLEHLEICCFGSTVRFGEH